MRQDRKSGPCARARAASLVVAGTIASMHDVCRRRDALGPCGRDRDGAPGDPPAARRGAAPRTSCRRSCTCRRTSDRTSSTSPLLRHGDERLDFDPARCLDCGFVFRDRRRPTLPSACRSAAGQHLAAPVFRITRRSSEGRALLLADDPGPWRVRAPGARGEAGALRGRRARQGRHARDAALPRRRRAGALPFAPPFVKVGRTVVADRQRARFLAPKLGLVPDDEASRRGRADPAPRSPTSSRRRTTRTTRIASSPTTRIRRVPRSAARRASSTSACRSTSAG